MDFIERVVGDLRVRIDPKLCVSFGDCVESAPEAFALNGDGVVAFVDPDLIGRSRLLDACAACPVDALTVLDDQGNQLVP